MELIRRNLETLQRGKTEMRINELALIVALVAATPAFSY